MSNPSVGRVPSVPVRVGLAVAILAVVCSAAYYFGGGSLYVPGDAISVDGASLDFGEVWEESRFVWVLPITNRTASEIEIDGFRSSCTCVNIAPDSARLKPGETTPVSLTLDLTYVPPQAKKQAVRAFRVTISPWSKTSTAPLGMWNVRGRVRSAIQVTPRVLDFGEQPSMDAVFGSRTLEISGFIPLSSLDVATSSSTWKASARRSTNSHNTFIVDVTPSQQMQQGLFDSEVILRPKLEDGTVLPAYHVRARGRVLDDVRALPSALLVAPVAVGSSVDEEVIVCSHSGRTFQIERLDCDVAEVQPFVETQELASSHVVRIRLQPRRPGDQRAKVVVRLRAQSQNLDPVTVPVRYFVESPKSGS